jgi:hypothetical protein
MWTEIAHCSWSIVIVEKLIIIQTGKIFSAFYGTRDRLCGLVVRVLGYRFGGPCSIPGTTRFSGKKKKKENK